MMDACQKSGQLAKRILAAVAVVFVASVLAPSIARAGNRVDLDDLNIKGELLNDNRLRMSSREQHKITDRVSYRSGFRKEITDGLEVNWPADETAKRGTASEGTNE